MSKKAVALFVCFGFAVMARFPKEIFSAACGGVNLWFNILFPALFPSMLAIRILSAIGVTERINNTFGGLMRIFKINSIGFEAFLGGFLSGFPTGGKITGELLESGRVSRKEAEKIFSVSNNPGIFFLLNTVGAGILSDAKCGYILVGAGILSSVISGIIISRGYKEERFSVKRRRVYKNFDFFMLREIIFETMDAITRAGGFIILFSVISAGVCLIAPFNDLGKALFSGVMEMTGGVLEVSRLNLPINLKISLISALTSFGGFSIMGQCMSMLPKGIFSFKKFARIRLINGGIAFLVSFFMCQFLL